MAHTDAAPRETPEGDLEESLERRVRAGLVRRIWQRDASLWAGAEARPLVARRLGWLDAPEAATRERPDLERLAHRVREEGFTHAALLGMGGSSLCPELLRRTFPATPGWPSLSVLDSTDPETVLRLTRALPLERTLFLVSSKSGTTLETRSFFRHFWSEAARARGVSPGEAFVAITDPGTPLDQEARQLGFRAVVGGPPDVGGRYSALTPFGLLPAALLGMDLGRLVGRALAARDECREDTPRNPGLRLGVWMAEQATRGRDKLTLVAPPAVAAFGLWLEQLLAESLGKDARGLVPVSEEPPVGTGEYGEDRLFVRWTMPGEESSAERRAVELARAGFPVRTRPLADPYDLGGEFFVWEFATAVAGALLGANPFDEPNVGESKENTMAVLAARGTAASGGRIGAESDAARGAHLLSLAPEPPGEPASGSPGQRARAWLAALPRGGYLAIQAFLADDAATASALASLRQRLFARTRLATTLGLGPRYLHSTGQLHKGGPPIGAFLQLTRRHAPALAIPGADYDFGALLAAQAEGDARSLLRRGRPLLRVSIDSPADLAAVERGF